MTSCSTLCFWICLFLLFFNHWQFLNLLLLLSLCLLRRQSFFLRFGSLILIILIILTIFIILHFKLPNTISQLDVVLDLLLEFLFVVDWHELICQKFLPYDFIFLFYLFQLSFMKIPVAP